MSGVSSSAGEGFAGGQESEGSIQERLQEIQQKAASFRQAQASMRKQEGKRKKNEEKIIAFLIACIEGGKFDAELSMRLTIALKHNHSAYLILTFLELIYNFDQEISSLQTLSIHHDASNKKNIEDWLHILEEVIVEDTYKVYHSMHKERHSMEVLLEYILLLYKNIYHPKNFPTDLVHMSQHVVQKTYHIAQLYLQSYSLQG